MGACLLISTNLPPGWFHQDHMWSLVNEYVVLISNDTLCKIQCEKDTSIKEVPKVWNLLYFFVITYDTDLKKKLEPAILLKYIFMKVLVIDVTNVILKLHKKNMKDQKGIMHNAVICRKGSARRFWFLHIFSLWSKLKPIINIYSFFVFWKLFLKM